MAVFVPLTTKDPALTTAAVTTLKNKILAKSQQIRGKCTNIIKLYQIID
jgi:hypothetical protein